MDVQLVIPVTRKTPARALGIALTVFAGLAVMWLLVGLIGTAVLAVELFLLGRLLHRAANGK
ncbi:hypothetical protein C8D88_101321 [Lentzea atacamensis]|uniref:Uncharacterized protein n=1 Tax=Lentzea atacamensis TaxID=531938 RepID=A0A316IT24_9PSEU|nr:hypothetical protein [Lentzea atacamensis]PWK90305.1 hypothetical protein C8D88_101321 [Lentzea atacamensis]RAS62948.1 hypothetical protein C8D87_10796 [Lentzea atacamensis]